MAHPTEGDSRTVFSPGVVVLLGSLFIIFAGQVKAGSDVDGAIDALIDAPLNTVGDLAGSAGLVSGGVMGGLGDVIALVDDNPYTRTLLRGMMSMAIRRLALGVSYTFTGMLEGLRRENLARYPESALLYLEPQASLVRIDDVMDGLGGTYVAFSDAVGNPALAVLRIGGATAWADRIAGWQTTVRGRYFGPLSMD